MAKPKEIHPELEMRNDYMDDKRKAIAEAEDLTKEQKQELAKYLRYKQSQNDITNKRACSSVHKLIVIFRNCLSDNTDPSNPTHQQIENASRKMNDLRESRIPSDFTFNDYIAVWRDFHHNVTRDFNEPLKQAMPTIPNKESKLFDKISDPERKNEVPNLTTKEMVKLIKSAPKCRDACIIGLYLELGVRPSELHKLEVNDITLNGWKGGPSAEVSVMVKKNKQILKREMLVTRVYPQLAMWYRKRKEMDLDTDRLFVNETSKGGGKKGRAMTGKNMNERVKKVGEKIGYDLTRSKLRNISVDYWFGNSGLGVNELKKKFGWKNFDRVLTYDRGYFTDLKEAKKKEDGLPQKSKDHFDLRKRVGCDCINPPTFEECRKCGLNLDPDARDDMMEDIIEKLTDLVYEDTKLNRKEASQMVNSIKESPMAVKMQNQETDLKQFLTA